MTRPARLDEPTVAAWVAAHPTWGLVDGHLVRELSTVDYPSSVAIVAAQVDLAERLDHHPILTIGYRQLRLELWTHDRGGITQLDLDYAEGFDALVARDFAAVVTG